MNIAPVIDVGREDVTAARASAQTSWALPSPLPPLSYLATCIQRGSCRPGRSIEPNQPGPISPLECRTAKCYIASLQQGGRQLMQPLLGPCLPANRC